MTGLVSSGLPVATHSAYCVCAKLIYGDGVFNLKLLIVILDKNIRNCVAWDDRNETSRCY